MQYICLDNECEKSSFNLEKLSPYPFKNKLIEAKDIIEIGLYFNLLESTVLFNLINILFDREDYIKDFTNIYPVSLYKLLTQYERMQTFDKLIEIEINSPMYNRKTISSIISKYFI